MKKYLLYPAAFFAFLIAIILELQPWNGPLLEEWSFIANWNSLGLSSFRDAFLGTIGRPLHLVPIFIALLISNGHIWGFFLIGAVVLCFQFLSFIWAFRLMNSDQNIRFILGIVLILHPWWAAGTLGRFIPAQTSLVWMLIAIGASVQFKRTSKNQWLYLAFVSNIFCLLTYQALAITIVFLAILLANTSSTLFDKKNFLIISQSIIATATVSVYSIFIAPLFFKTYESQLIGKNINFSEYIVQIYRTLFIYSYYLVPLVLLILAGIGFSLYLKIRKSNIVISLIILFLSPLTALTYSGTSLHLNDPERIIFPVGTTLFFLFAFQALQLFSKFPNVIFSVLSLVLVCSLVVATLNIFIYKWYSNVQQETLNIVENFTKELPEGSKILLVDNSGKLGDVYTFLPPFIDIAYEASNEKKNSISICTPSNIVRLQPLASRYPIETTPDCPDLMNAISISKNVTTSYGEIELFVLTK